MNRRDFLKLSVAMGVTSVVPDGTARGQPSSAAAGTLPYAGLATSMTQEVESTPQVEGRIPQELRGALYRNGPGLFERDGYRKLHLLDGDGMIREYRFTDAGAIFRNRFVRTRKYVEESRAGRYLYATWTTRRPGGMLRNILPDVGDGQAGVSVRYRSGRLYAFDESSQPYQLKPETLETVGQSLLGLDKGLTLYSAHPKEDLETGEWIHFGLEYGRHISIHLTEFTRDGALKWHRVLKSPRYVYVHDFFVTERYIVLYLHPAEIAVSGFLLGERSFFDSIRWKPELGGRVLVIRRGSNDAPLELEAEAAWMWHSLNAYDAGEDIVVEYVASENPDSFLGPEAAFRTVMEGRYGKVGAPSAVRRMVIQPGERRLRTEVLDGGRHEFPVVNPERALRRHRYGYFAFGTGEDAFFNGVVRMNMDSGKRQEFAFGPEQYCGEPLYITPRGRSGSSEDDGWLLTEVHDGRTRKNSLAVLRADRVEDGPLAQIQLSHGLPLSFHGCWVGV